ncbi:MAG: Bax inhibitor-1/YccA family protein [Clostridia bacterium]
MKMTNPVISKLNTTIENSSFVGSGEVRSASYGGVATKLLFALVTIASAILSASLLFSAVENENGDLMMFMLIGMALSFIPMLIIAFVVSFFPSTIKVLGFVYCVLEGAFLGITSAIFDANIQGIVFSAILATMAVFLVTLLVYRVSALRSTSKFRRFIFITFISLVAVEMLLGILSLFVPAISMVFNTFWLQLGICALSIVYATIMLYFDFENISGLVNRGMDKKYEWTVAFGLITTLIWMYIRILQLLALLFSHND